MIKAVLSFLVWFPPIVGQTHYFSVDVLYTYAVSTAASVLFLLLNPSLGLNRRLFSLLVAFIIFISYVLSFNYKIFYWILIVLVLLMWSSGNYKLPLRQYLHVALLFSGLALLDLALYFFTGRLFIMKYEGLELGGIFPRYSFIFDEMSHFGMFLIPGVVYSFINNRYFMFTLLSSAIIFTLSGSVILIYSLLIALLLFNKKGGLWGVPFLLLLLYVVIFSLGYDDQILSKVSLFDADNDALRNNLSMLNNLFYYEFLKHTSLTSFLLGSGLSSASSLYSEVIQLSPMYSFFVVHFISDETQVFTWADIITKVGALFFILMVYFFGRAYSGSRYSLYVVLPFIIYGFKMSHSVEYFQYYFVFYYLAFVIRYENTSYY